MADSLMSKYKKERNTGDTFVNRAPYALPTRIGNWYEDLLIDLERQNRTVYRKKLNLLTVQQVHKTLFNVLQPVETTCESETVRHNENYQLQACKLTTVLKNVAGHPTLKLMCLSGLINEHSMNAGGLFTHGCYLTASQIMAPCRKNMFVFEDPKNKDNNGPLLFGVPFFIKLVEVGSAEPLYVQFENNTVDDFGQLKMLKLTRSPDNYCLFKAIHWYPHVRPETVKTPVFPDTKIIIQHVASGQNMNVEYSKWVPTFFGTECMVNCRTVMDIHRMEGAENMWIILGRPIVHKDMMVRAARGEEIPEEMLH